MDVSRLQECTSDQENPLIFWTIREGGCMVRGNLYSTEHGNWHGDYWVTPMDSLDQYNSHCICGILVAAMLYFTLQLDTLTTLDQNCSNTLYILSVSLWIMLDWATCAMDALGLRPHDTTLCVVYFIFCVDGPTTEILDDTFYLIHRPSMHFRGGKNTKESIATLSSTSKHKLKT